MVGCWPRQTCTAGSLPAVPRCQQRYITKDSETRLVNTAEELPHALSGGLANRLVTGSTRQSHRFCCFTLRVICKTQGSGSPGSTSSPSHHCRIPLLDTQDPCTPFPTMARSRYPAPYAILHLSLRFISVGLCIATMASASYATSRGGYGTGMVGAFIAVIALFIPGLPQL
jgi:hypothetical protein